MFKDWLEEIMPYKKKSKSKQHKKSKHKHNYVTNVIVHYYYNNSAKRWIYAFAKQCDQCKKLGGTVFFIDYGSYGDSTFISQEYIETHCLGWKHVDTEGNDFKNDFTEFNNS